MAKKSEKNKNVIIGCVCAVIAVVVVVVLAIAIATSSNGGLNDSYFVSDGEKYVLTIDTDQATIDDADEEYIPTRTHLVYFYTDDTITGLKVYYEYADAGTAKLALAEMQEESGDELTDTEVSGKYVVITATAEQYEGLTASDVKAQIELIESLENAEIDESTDDSSDSADDATTEEAEETTTEGTSNTEKTDE